jgi:hypothetical protein
MLTHNLNLPIGQIAYSSTSQLGQSYRILRTIYSYCILHTASFPVLQTCTVWYGVRHGHTTVYTIHNNANLFENNFHCCLQVLISTKHPPACEFQENEV